VEALADLARGLDPSDDAAGDLKQGALLCLLGDHEAGGALVTAAAQTQKRSSGEALPGADLAFVGCGAASAPTDPTDREAAAWAATLGEPSVAAIDRVEALLDETQDLAPNLRLRLAALVVAARDDLSPVATLRLFTPREGAPAGLDAATYLSPWTVLADRRTVPASLPALETSIARLERLLGELSDHDEPLVCRGEDCPREASLESPADTLRRLLFALRLEHAAEALRRGRRDAAKASLLAAEPHAGVHDRHLLGPLWLAVGEPRRALDAVESRSDLLAQLTRSFALRDLDRLEDAEAAAAAGYAAAQRDGDEHAVAFGWLWAALALERGSSDHLRAALAEATSQGEAELADWLALAGMPEAERLPLRYDAELEDPPLAALPAVVAVVARAVPPDAAVEVWLDRVLADRHRSHPATTWLARAKAAELRGDRTAAATARARGLRVLELAKDDRASLLLDLAGLR
ncbi:MAG: hypothetical protein KC731_38635, partial [Myxococcales bacterium]|nr:hypothetical protein [Myxococcales bacterium]